MVTSTLSCWRSVIISSMSEKVTLAEREAHVCYHKFSYVSYFNSITAWCNSRDGLLETVFTFITCKM